MVCVKIPDTEEAEEGEDDSFPEDEWFKRSMESL